MSSTSIYTDKELYTHCHELYQYLDGKLYSKKDGRELGYPNQGYLQFMTYINQKKITVKVHRLVFLMHHGFLPQKIDHVNGNSLDNRIENLRECTSAQNSQNMRKKHNSTSQFKGVSYIKSNPKAPWRGTIKVDGKFIHLGFYSSEEEAAAAYALAAATHFGEYARTC